MRGNLLRCSYQMTSNVSISPVLSPNKFVYKDIKVRQICDAHACLLQDGINLITSGLLLTMALKKKITFQMKQTFSQSCAFAHHCQ